MFSIPIIYIFYKRPDLVRQTFLPIKKIKPRFLYLCQDGPKNEEERAKILEARKIILDMIGWDCKLVKIFRKKNMGLMGHIPDSLNRFFKDNQYGIYIEEDVLVSDEFFKYQKEMLLRFKNDQRIYGISGFNPFCDKLILNDSYYLSQMASIWGVGLYKRLWKEYNLYHQDAGRVIKKLLKNNYFFSKEYAFYLKNYIEAINQGKLKTWDLQISYVTAKNNKFFIFPKSNLVNNIGFNKDGTSPFILSYYQPTEKIFPLIHPQKFIYNSIYDVIYFDNLLKGGWLRLWLIKIYLDLPESLKKLVQKFLALLFTFRKYV